MDIDAINKNSDHSFKERFCGYCRKLLNLNLEEFMKHTKYCEVDCCNKKYGDLGGQPA